MSECGPPTEEDIRQFRSKLSRTADWVSKHSTPTSPTSSYSSPTSTRPPTTRTNSYSSGHHRDAPRPAPPPGFKFAPAGTPVSYKTEAATYYVVPPGAPVQIIDHDSGQTYYIPPSSSKPHHSRRHSSSHHGHQSSSSHSTSNYTTSTAYYPVQYEYVNSPSPGPMRPAFQHSYSTPVEGYTTMGAAAASPVPIPSGRPPVYIKTPTKDKPLFQKLFGVGDPRPHSSSRGRDSGVTIAW